MKAEMNFDNIGGGGNNFYAPTTPLSIPSDGSWSAEVNCGFEPTTITVIVGVNGLTLTQIWDKKTNTNARAYTNSTTISWTYATTGLPYEFETSSTGFKAKLATGTSSGWGVPVWFVAT